MIQCDEQEEKEEIDEEIEDEEFIDEEYEDRHGRSGSIFAGRSVTLQMLLSAGLLQPGEGTMAIEYLGQRFIGDLLPDGKIKSQETDIVFASPSAWAIHCKRIINPDKKSGCGWASVKYKGKKLDAYKNTWFKNRKKEQDKENKLSDDDDMEKDKVMPIQRIILKHAVVGSRSIGHDPNTLIESTAFSSIGKIQPFLVSMATNAVLVMDFHCHLTTSEVVGYLAGHWDVNAHNLAITHAFPCKSRLGDKEMAQMVEADIYRAIDQRHLTLVGWYHSHPFAASTPTLKDIDAQLDYQIRMKGSSDASYTPCIGVICSPYFKDSVVLESSVICYWVMPPPESKPHEYGKPMLMTYSVVQDQFLSQDALNEMKHLVEFYKNEQDFIRFTDKYKGNTTFLEKLKATLTSKFPRDQSDGILWSFIRDLVCPGAANTLENGLNLSMCKPFSIPEVPSLSSSKQNAADKVNILVPSIHIPSPNKSLSSSSVSGNLMMNPDIASAIFGSGKFPPASALLGLSPDSGRSIIGSGNMNSIFASPLAFKMDNISIVKPLSNVNNNPLPSTSKSSSLATEVPAIPVKALPIDSTNFTPPESLDKNCTVTSGQT